MSLRLGPPQTAWILLLASAGLGTVACAAGALEWSPQRLGLAASFTAAAFLTYSWRVRLSRDHYDYALDDVPLYALIFLDGWAMAVVVMAAANLAYEVYRLARALRTTPERVVPASVAFNFSHPPLVALWAAAAGGAYHLADAGDPLLGTGRNLAALAACAAVLFAVSTATHAVNVCLFRGEPLGRALGVLRRTYSRAWLHLLMLAPLGALLALFVLHQPVAAALLVVPLVMMHTSLDSQGKLLREAERTIQALATYLDERDHYTLGHSQRVAGYARVVAAEMGLTPSEVERVYRAGLIHDIGKVDIPDAVLRKPGRLSEEERAVMRAHTGRAVDLGRKLVALRREIPFDVAAYHHERYDGLDSLYGVKGEEIPLLSRILAVADTWDAMTSDRPYRPGLPEEEALERLRQARRAQLDPRVVDAFLRAREKGALKECGTAHHGAGPPSSYRTRRVAMSPKNASCSPLA